LKCPKCQTDNPDTQKFCGECGHNLTIPSEPAQKGLIYRVRKNDQRLYQACQFLIGIYEFQLKNLDKEFCELFEEYLPYYGISIKNVKTKQLRVITERTAIAEAIA